MPIITFTKEKKKIEVKPGANLRTEAKQAGIQLYPGVHKVLNCHGFGHCGSCRVNITKGQENVSKMGLLERLRLFVSVYFIGNEKTMRLACQSQVNGDIEVETQPALNLYGEPFFK